ncbi:MAG: carboxylesterase/lipase family protein [Clostridia bacterium]|nr:carboxylesterase/lipase family protein [Clostridia bacterium]
MIRRVKVENGWVRGLPAADPRITSYKGIPFADKPIGKNRWRAPQPCPDWEGELFAADFGPIAMQANCAGDPAKDIYAREWAVDAELPMSEDCLYLNVWAPADGRKNMPVYVWYFGGGLQVGNTTEMEFDGERIARRGIVVVTVGYRLNVFGFLCHPEITTESPEAPANFGFLDQQCATRWVKRNIAAFGGDPENITIGGQSAGGMSVCAQMTCPQNEGLFQRAIVESGTFAQPYGAKLGLFKGNMKEAEEQGIRFFDALGVKTLEEARALDARTIENMSLQWPWGCWGETVDGVFSLYASNEWYLHPERVQCPVLLGHTSNEFFAVPDADSETALSDFANRVFPEHQEEFLSHFSHPATENTIAKEGKLNAISFAVRMAARMNEKFGIRYPLYNYLFDAEIPGWDNPGTFHSVDLWFFFETLAKCWRPFTGKHYDLARQMCDYWVNFIRSGDPNGLDSQGKALPPWPALNNREPMRMNFADTSAAEVWNESALEAFLIDRYLEKRI